jgi:NUMOD1 domain
MRKAAISKSPELLAKLSKAQPTSIEVKVTDLLKKKVYTYNAIRAAAKALNIDKRSIEKYLYLSNMEPVLNRYIFDIINKDKDKIKLNRVQKTSKQLKVVNVKTDEVFVYPSIGSAARVLGLHQASISLYLKERREKPFKDTYLFKLI